MDKFSWWQIIQISEVFATLRLQNVESNIQFNGCASACNMSYPLPVQNIQLLINITQRAAQQAGTHNTQENPEVLNPGSAICWLGE